MICKGLSGVIVSFALTCNKMCEDLAGADSLHIADYAVFVLMLLVSATIGLHYAWIGRRQQNTQEFLTGDRKLTALPVSLSLTASDLSSIILISIPVEVMCGIGLRLKFSHCTFIFSCDWLSLRIFDFKLYLHKYKDLPRSN